MASTRVFTIPASAPGTTFDITIGEPLLKRNDLGDSTWSSSLVLASCLHRIPAPSTSPTSPHHSLELGAGTGLVGLAAAALWGAEALLTDYATVVANLDANIALNAALLRHSQGGAARAGTLDWWHPDSLIVSEAAGGWVPPRTFRSILAADTVYDEEHPRLLARVVLDRLERSAGARFCIAYALRVAYLEQIREMWTRLEEGGLVCVQEGREEVGEEWDDERQCEWAVWKWAEV